MNILLTHTAKPRSRRS